MTKVVMHIKPPIKETQIKRSWKRNTLPPRIMLWTTQESGQELIKSKNSTFPCRTCMGLCSQLEACGFNVSGCAYHEMAKLCQEMPRHYKLKKKSLN